MKKVSALERAYRVIDLLKKDPRVVGTCPSCGEEFRFAKAKLFPVQPPWPIDAKIKMFARRMALTKRRTALKRQREQLTTGVERTTEGVWTGKLLECVAPSLSSFPFNPGDCRSLQLIDLIAWQGLQKTGQVNAISFVEVKSGGARLSAQQSQVRDAVQAGKVRLVVLDGKGGPHGTI